MTTKKDSKQTKVASKTELLWRKPITLDDADDDDPLALLYQGREVGEQNVEAVKPTQKAHEAVAESADIKSGSTAKLGVTKEKNDSGIKKKTEKVKTETFEQAENLKPQSIPKVTESELKAVLKIKSESFEFTDIREILRGKSLDMYAYLRYLSGESGVCKIKHLDLMKKLDISRPTLFKQGEWLNKLSLIEKRNVPGDHFGTSYTVYRFEAVLPVSETVIKQLEAHIKNVSQTY